MIPRTAAKEASVLAQQFKAVAIVGPRQSGKTTLVKDVFPQKDYVNLENPDMRSFAQEDPRGFLAHYPDGAILDEAQRVPPLFSYLQQILDEKALYGQYILTGSNNFILQESISQSLAGRVGYLYLLPLALAEWPGEENKLSHTLFRGGYPALYQTEVEPARWYANYIQTYVERDVRLIKNISNLSTFERFLKLCAGRIGQLLNMSNLAVETGVDVKTIGSWLSILESSFVIFRLPPYHRNFNKRIVKMPKLYFYDTGLASALLGIEHAGQLDFHPLRGPLFENLVILEFMKRRLHQGKTQNLYFWRDNVGHEVDLLLDEGPHQRPIEIKLGQTITTDFFKGLQYWNKISETRGGFVVYGGSKTQKRSSGFTVVPYRQIESVPG